MLYVEQALEDPVVQPCLAQLIAVQDRPHTLPPLLHEPHQRAGRLFAVEVADAVEEPGGPVDAEPALARAHPQPELAAYVVEVGAAATPHLLLQAPAADQLALTDQL